MALLDCFPEKLAIRCSLFSSRMDRLLASSASLYERLGSTIRNARFYSLPRPSENLGGGGKGGALCDTLHAYPVIGRSQKRQREDLAALVNFKNF